MNDIAMYQYTSDYWRIALPEDWELTGEEDDLAVFAGPADSELCLSCTVMDEDLVELEDLEEFAGDLLTEGHEPDPVSAGGMHGLYFAYTADQREWREWYLASDNIFIYITLNYAPGASPDAEALLDHFEVLD